MVKEKKSNDYLKYHNVRLIEHIDRRIDNLRVLDKKEWFSKLEVFKKKNIIESDDELTNINLKKNNENLLLLDFNLGEARKKEDCYFSCIKIPLLHGVDTYKEEYPDPNISINKYYVDQGYQRIDTEGFHSFSGFTPYGLKMLDAFYFNEIMKSEFNVSKEDLELAIKKQPNLHNVIKTNLLNNLSNRV